MRSSFYLLPLLPLLFGAGAAAAEDSLDRVAAVSDEILAEQRGGFNWGGMQISFGADIRSYVDEQLALRTIVSWTADGATVDRFVSPSLTAADAAHIQAGILTSGGIEMRVGDETIFLANDGQTALIHSTDSIQNVLVNTASGVKLAQQVDATLNLTDYSGFSNALAMTHIASTIGDAVGAGTLGALGN